MSAFDVYEDIVSGFTEPVVDLSPRNIIASAFAGAVAVIPNELVLKAADKVFVLTAHGGLLVLTKLFLSKMADMVGMRQSWDHVVVPMTIVPSFQIAFHAAIAILMGLVYGIVVGPADGRRWLRLGVIYGMIVWLMNAFVVLPATGEGIAGLRTITAFGAIWFAAAHFTFFIVLAGVYRAAAHRLVGRRAA